MKEKMEKYANLILMKGVNIKKGQPLFLIFPMEQMEFVRILIRRAYELGVVDIFFAYTDPELKHDQLKYLDEKDMKNYILWNKKDMSRYAKKGAAFVTLSSESPEIMKDIDAKKLGKMNTYGLRTSRYFDQLRNENTLAWTIAAVPTIAWAEKVFPHVKDPVKKLWEVIFDICLINKDDPLKAWDEKINTLEERSKKLNELHLTSLHFTNDLGTDLTIELSKKHVWSNSRTTLANGTKVVCNIPSEEVFTFPMRNGVNGIVYNSKPLVHNGNIIDSFWIKFKKGKVIDLQAKVGEEVLRETIFSNKNGNYLGEVALVPYDSSINKTNILFYETLYDENASSHLAFGNAFTECFRGYEKMSRREQKKAGLNQSSLHLDFMIGTKDLKIIGKTKDKKKVTIFENGNFSSSIKNIEDK